MREYLKPYTKKQVVKIIYVVRICKRCLETFESQSEARYCDSCEKYLEKGNFQKNCKKCKKPLTFLGNNKRWFCYECNEFDKSSR